MIGLVAFALLFGGPLLVAASGTIRFSDDWRTADRSSAHLAPDPKLVQEAIVQVYSARAFNWRGAFGVHTWIATKARGADHYLVHQLVGWRLFDRASAVESEPDVPDRNWYGQPPEIMLELRGARAEAIIPDILEAVRSYPWPGQYRLWPGPNSNTFTAWVARRVPALGLDLPPTAIGKDYLGGALFAPAASGTGWEVSLLGLLGVTVARSEGLEFNLFGACFGLNPRKAQLRLPGLGIIGRG